MDEKTILIQNIIFDIGGVLANPLSGNWFITPNFYTIIDKNKINETELLESLKKYQYLHTQEPKNEKEEYQMFMNYYYQVLKNINYPITKKIAEDLAHDCVLNDDKFIFFEDVANSLELLSKNYNLYIISNGWPSSIRVLNNKNIAKNFKSIYISSMYGTIKEEKLFDIFLEKENIKPECSLYIDDREHVLDKAKEYHFNLLKMIRNNPKSTKYQSITSMLELINYLNQK